ncbi:tetratricopeptide repeat protein [Actinacidiphila yeochonensis]|uniref:hypothetical protein n=1 Tax=Actinacidiphila yeochonensis TaxID=89050 RepID=UPI000689F278|nr:hypothetical protein [Actinacidiphila yeochonensis]
MPLFGRRTAEKQEKKARERRQSWGLVAPPRLDTDLGDPRLTAVLGAARSGDWAGVRELLASAAEGPGLAGPWTDDLSWLVNEVMDVDGAEEWLARAVADDPRDPLARLALGTRQIGWAWEARSAKLAKYVSKEQFAVFHARLRDAEEHLYEAAELAPEWVAPWYFLLTSGRGLQVGQDAARRRLDAVVARFPHHLPAHRVHLQQVCAKWGGSHEKMHDFARTAMLAAPEGSPFGELVALAQLEEWYGEPKENGTSSLAQPEAAGRLGQAWERSLGHAAFQRHPGWTASANTFAMTFSLAGRKQSAVEVFAMLNGAVCRSPWNRLKGGADDPVGTYTRWQARMLR